jgi:mRNA interferase RelE/StbE
VAFYNICFKNSVEKEFKKLPKSVLRRVTERIELLAANPFPHGVSKISGAEHLYRIRVGVYRIIYSIDDPKK